MKPSELSIALESAILNKLPLLITGPPGVGKSDIAKQVCERIGYDLITTYPPLEDPTSTVGLPWPDKDNGHANFLPFGQLAKILTAQRPTVWFLDDLGQASDAVQKAYMQWLLARENGAHRLPDNVTIIAATNRRTDRAGVSGMLEPVKSRFASIVSLEPNLEDSCNWFLDNGYPSEIVAFLRFRRNLLHGWTAFCSTCKKYVITGAAGQCLTCENQLSAGPTNDLVNSPSPRTWTNAAKWIQVNPQLPPEIELTMINGAVGEGAGCEFVGFLRIARKLPSIEGILKNPDKEAIPDDPAALLATTSALANLVDKKNFKSILRYAERLYEIRKAEVAILLITDCLRRDQRLGLTAAWQPVASGPLGKLISSIERIK